MLDKALRNRSFRLLEELWLENPDQIIIKNLIKCCFIKHCLSVNKDCGLLVRLRVFGALFSSVAAKIQHYQ